MDYIASAENIAAKLCNKYRRIDRSLADMAAIEAAEIYEYSSAVNGAWDFECWVVSRIWQCYLSRKQHKQEENNMATKLTDKDRRAIREKFRAGDNIDEIARGYDISGQTVRNICSDLAYERKQAISAFNSVQPKVKSAEEMAQENQQEPVEAAPAEVGQGDPAEDVRSAETADVPSDTAAAENISDADGGSEPVSGVKDVNLYDLVRGFESFCRENVPGDFNVVINKNGDVISVTAANEVERLTYERGVNE
jgi:hypothetical protein